RGIPFPRRRHQRARPRRDAGDAVRRAAGRTRSEVLHRLGHLRDARPSRHPISQNDSPGLVLARPLLDTSTMLGPAMRIAVMCLLAVAMTACGTTQQSKTVWI